MFLLIHFPLINNHLNYMCIIALIFIETNRVYFKSEKMVVKWLY
ncbi:hypothetical protein XBI1_2280034 [Xenorhabdus bovienii str. Intermedium]|uniref:Uncharacterized protein n=1 Tax=Xenorhabdus bovienii str. Intermedium TaxID=1379677 RepID=A0A077QI31_XENBV|nr:hypothetical protein XBI1_2280034 [Xenorhabdus bovienii str. Intermedium]